MRRASGSMLRPDERLFSPGVLDPPVGSLLARPPGETALADSVSVGSGSVAGVGVAGVGGAGVGIAGVGVAGVGVAAMGGVETRCGAATAATAGTGAVEGVGDAGVASAFTTGNDDVSDPRELAGT